MSDFNKAKLIIEKINNESSLKGIETIIDELSESINYFDNTKVSKEILDNQDYIDLCNYVQDAYLLLSIQGLNVQDFIDKLKQESKTDIYTYLDNYVTNYSFFGHFGTSIVHINLFIIHHVLKIDRDIINIYSH